MPNGEPVAARGRRGGRGLRARRGQAGYSLVLVIMVVTVLSIMISASLPLWSERIKRDKEEELISRGFQYVEAIRIFQKRFGRLPVTFDELIKAKPRCIRQLWKDPMTADGQFDPIYQGQGSVINVPGLGPNGQNGLTGQGGISSNNPQTGQPGQGTQTGQGSGSGSGSSGANQGQGSDPFDPGQVKLAAGPIVGVRSRSTAKSLLLFYGHEHYNEWDFRIEMLSGGRGGLAGIGIPGPGGGDGRFSTRWLGRPMPGLPGLPGSLTPGSVPVPGSLGLGGSSGASGAPGTGSSGGGTTAPAQPPANGKPFG